MCPSCFSDLLAWFAYSVIHFSYISAYQNPISFSSPTSSGTFFDDFPNLLCSQINVTFHLFELLEYVIHSLGLFACCSHLLGHKLFDRRTLHYSSLHYSFNRYLLSPCYVPAWNIMPVYHKNAINIRLTTCHGWSELQIL